MRVHAAYGSTKDISVYSSISLSPMQIYIVGRPTKKLQHQCQVGAALPLPFHVLLGASLCAVWYSMGDSEAALSQTPEYASQAHS